MKLNKKIILVSAAALMALSPAIALTQNNERFLQLARKPPRKQLKLVQMVSRFITKRVIFILARKKLRVIAQLRLMVSPFGLLVAFHFCQAIVFQ